MPSPDELVAAITSQILGAGPLNLSSSSELCDLFEAYVFSIVLDAAMREGASLPIQFENIYGATATQVTFRTSPGRIFPSSPTATTPPYTHAIIQFANKPALELHQGIYVSGKSGLLHECDIAILLRSEGQTCRQNRVHPRCAKVVFASECKFYAGGLGIGLARGFLGLTTDIWKQGRFFVSNSASSSSQKLLTHHDRKWAESLVPADATRTNRFRALVERIFEEFKASN
jgi:hypothetical protein